MGNYFSRDIIIFPLGWLINRKKIHNFLIFAACNFKKHIPLEILLLSCSLWEKLVPYNLVFKELRVV